MFNLDATRRCVVSLTVRPLYPYHSVCLRGYMGVW
jgi:hypothetical protein